jgi:hypothetical protein
MELTSEPSVLNELHVSRTGRQQKRFFNKDFILEFVNRATMTTNHRSLMAPFLPNTIGVDIFLSIDQDTKAPLLMETMCGEALGPEYYGEYIDRIEEMIANVVRTADYSITETSRVAKARYSRVIVVGNDICFLICPELETPTMNGERRRVHHSQYGDVYFQGNHGSVACIDGWLRASPTAKSEWKVEVVQ